MQRLVAPPTNASFLCCCCFLFFFYWNLSGLNAETHTAYDWYTVIIIGEQSVLTVHLETISSCSVF